MKNKEKIITILICVFATTITSIVTAYATNYLYNADEVSYDKTNTELTATDVQGAIDQLYTKATEYTSLTNRISALETPTTLDVATTDTTNFKAGTIHLIKVGKIVHCYTSLSTNKNITTTWSWVNVQTGVIPAAYRPKVNTLGVAVRQDSSSSIGAWAESLVNTSGTLAFRFSSTVGTTYAVGTSLVWVTN